MLKKLIQNIIFINLGMQFSSGLVCRKHLKAEEDADVIKNMKNAGAILLCTTNISELGLYYG